MGVPLSVKLGSFVEVPPVLRNAGVTMLPSFLALFVLKLMIRKEKKNWERVWEVEERSRERRRHACEKRKVQKQARTLA